MFAGIEEMNNTTTSIAMTPFDEEDLYEKDYQQWLDRTVDQLRSQAFEALDLVNLIDEVESLGQNNRHALASYLMRLCEHLLKVQYWQTERERCLRGWTAEIRNFRIQIQKKLKASPSLKRSLPEIFVEEYQNGRKTFLDRSGLEPGIVPMDPPFTLEEAIDEDWLWDLG